jgi:integrase
MVREKLGLYRRNDRFWWISYTVAGRQVFESSHSLNKRVAKRLLAVRQAEIAEGRFRFVKSNPPRLEEWAAEFLDSIQHQNTRRRYTSSIGNLLAFFRAARLSEVTVDRIEAFKRVRLKSRVKSATVNRDLAVLRRMLKLAARQRLIAQSPFEEVEFLEERKHRRQPHILTFEEQERLLAVAPPRLRVLITLLTETGLRVNKEALSLKWKDVELVNGVIHVRQSKTPAGVRSVPLSELCKAELIRWHSFLNLEEILPVGADRARISGISVPEFPEPTILHSTPCRQGSSCSFEVIRGPSSVSKGFVQIEGHEDIPPGFSGTLRHC